MVDFKNEQLYRQDSIDKQLKIEFDSGTITNSDIPSEQFELTESLTSESQLVFGSCEASEIKFRIYNVFLPLKDKWLTVLQTLDGDTSSTLQIGKYKVYSDKPTADRGYRDVVAYDAMYDIISTDVASWYNGLTFPMSLKAFRDSFFAFFGIEQIEVSLVNDSMEIDRTIDVQVLSGRDVIQSICEINGCFGHIARNGKFKYVFLETIRGGLYPSNDIYPANDLFPVEPNVQTVGKGLYVDTPTYEDFTVKPIDKLQIREKEGDIGVIVGNGDNTYIVEDNFLVYGKSTEDLTVIAENMLSVIDGLEYRPFDATLVGNPCFEVGDMVRLNTKYQIIDSYVLQRTLSGVQALRDNFTAEGEEYQSEKVNDIQTEIKQLRGKSNTLERSIEETRSTIADVEQGLQSEISQTADEIRFTVAKTQVEWDTSRLDGGPILYDYGPPTISPDTGFAYYVDVETGTWYMAGVVEGGTPKWYNMGQLENVFENMSSEIEQNAQRIALKVTRGEVSSELSVEDSQITISGNRLVVDSTNFNLDENGNVALTGEVNATTFSANESVRIYSYNSLYEGEKNYVDAIYTKITQVGALSLGKLHSNIENFDRAITTPYLTSVGLLSNGNVQVNGNFIVSGEKSRVASTDNYNERLLYCYEMPSPLFGDIGHGVIAEDGTCYVDIDSIFAETIDTIQEYYVFLTPYKTDKTMFVAEKEHGYFIVKGEPNTEFDWEIKAKQLDFSMERLEESIVEDTNDIDYEEQAINYLNEYEKELTSYEY